MVKLFTQWKCTMKKMIAAALTLMTTLSLSCWAAYTGPENNDVAANEVKELRDESWVTLQGKLVKHLEEDHFILRDATGEVVVEIDDDAWRGQAVTPNDTVRISGEVDQDGSGVKVDVQSLEKVGAVPMNKGGFSSL